MSVVFTNAKVLIGGYDLSGQFNRVALENTVQALDVTAFGAASKTMRGGLRSARLTGSGFWSASANSVDPALFEAIGLNDTVTLVFPDGITEGATSTGSGYGFKTLVARYSPLGAGVGDVAPFTVEAEGRGV